MFLSQQGFEKSGYTIRDFEKGLNMMQFVAPQDRDRAIKNIMQLIAGQDIGLNEYTLTAKDGTAYPAFIKTSTIISENKVTGIRGIVIDLTERKKAEDALALSEVTFKAYLEGCPLAVFAANSDGKYEYVNDVAVKMLGYSREELLNMTTRQVVPKNDSRGSFRFNELKEKGYFAGVLKLRQKNGRIIDVSLNSCKCPDGKLVAFCEDITENKKAEEALIESEAKFEMKIPERALKIKGVELG
jgi:PAS domain S-box-containing protein